MDKTILSQITSSFKSCPSTMNEEEEESVWREFLPVIFVGVGEESTNITNAKTPMAMLPICDTPILYYNLRYLKLSGFTECVLIFPKRYEKAIEEFLKEKSEATGLNIVCEPISDTMTEVEALYSIRDKVKTTNYLLLRGNQMFIFPYYLICDMHRKYRPLVSLVMSNGITLEKHPLDRKANPDKLKYVCGYKLQHEANILENPPLPKVVKKKPVHELYRQTRPINSGFVTGVGDAAAVHYLNPQRTNNNSATGVELTIPRKIIYDEGHLSFGVFEISPVILASSKLLDIITLIKEEDKEEEGIEGGEGEGEGQEEWKMKFSSLWEDLIPWIVFQGHASRRGLPGSIQEFLDLTTVRSPLDAVTTVPMTIVGSRAESEDDDNKFPGAAQFGDVDKYPFNDKIAPAPTLCSTNPLSVKAYVIPGDVHSRLPIPSTNLNKAPNKKQQPQQQTQKERRLPNHIIPLLHINVTNEYTLQIANSNILAGLLPNLNIIPSDFLSTKSKTLVGSFIGDDVTFQGKGPIVKNSVIGGHSKVDEAKIENSVIMGYCEIMKGCEIKGCVICPNTIIEENVKMSGCVIGPGIGTISPSGSPYENRTLTSEMMSDYDF